MKLCNFVMSNKTAPKKQKSTKAGPSRDKDLNIKKQRNDAAHTPRLPEVCWYQVLNFALSDQKSLEVLDQVDDLEDANMLRNLTLVSKDLNHLNTDLLWSLVFNHWKTRRNKFHGDGGKGIHAIGTAIGRNCTLQLRGEGEDKVLHYSPPTAVNELNSGAACFNLRLAPPQLRAMECERLLSLGISINKNTQRIVAGFSSAMKTTLKTSCIHCRCVPLHSELSLKRLKGDVTVVRSWENARREVTHTYAGGQYTYSYIAQINVKNAVVQVDPSEAPALQVDDMRRSSRTKKTVNYKESTEFEDDRIMQVEDVSAGSSSSSSFQVENFNDLLCNHCLGLGKMTHTTEAGFTRGVVMPTSRCQFEYASTKGQLAPLPHMEKTWYGNPSKHYLRRHVIAATRRRFGSFENMKKRKNELKRKPAGSMYQSTHMKNLYRSWGCGGYDY